MSEEHALAEQGGDIAVVRELGSLVPGQGEPEVWEQAAEGGDEGVAHGRGAVIAGQVHQLEVAAGAVDQGSDRRLVAASDDQVAFPITDPGACADDRWPVVDQLGWRDEPTSSLVGAVHDDLAIAVAAEFGKPRGDWTPVEIVALCPGPGMAQRVVAALREHEPIHEIDGCRELLTTNRQRRCAPLLVGPLVLVTKLPAPGIVGRNCHPAMITRNIRHGDANLEASEYARHTLVRSTNTPQCAHPDA